MKSYKEIQVGYFKVTSGKVVVSDPCYERGTWCQGELKNVKKGNWNSKILKTDEGNWGSRVAALIATYGDRDIAYSCPSWQQQSFEVGVDSGQAGIYDDTGFKSDDGNYDDPKSWYSRCCELTLKGDGAGIIEDSGVVSSSGYGDGGYDCKVIMDGKKIVAIMIDFGLLQEQEEEVEVEE